MTIYFAYGSNMSSARLAGRIASARALGAASLDGFRIAFDKPGSDGTAKANLVAAAGERVWGVAYSLADEDWPRLDAFEPGYLRTSVRIVRSGCEGSGAEDARAYVFPGPADPRVLPPSDAYLAHLVTGAREHGLPEAWVAWISECAARVG